MHQHILAAAGTCTGNWQQQWQCGSHGGGDIGAPTVHAASTFTPVAIGVLILLTLIAIARGRKPATN
jgi:hypothetical protein